MIIVLPFSFTAIKENEPYSTYISYLILVVVIFVLYYIGLETSVLIKDISQVGD